MKMEHFSQIGVTEVFLEATPTVYVLTVIFLSAFEKNVPGLHTQLYGNYYYGGEYTYFVLFFLTYATSITSAAFGISRETINQVL